MASSSPKPLLTSSSSPEKYIEYKFKDNKLSKRGSLTLPSIYRVEETPYGINIYIGTTRKTHRTYFAACENGRIFYGSDRYLHTVGFDKKSNSYVTESVVADDIENELSYSLLNQDILLICRRERHESLCSSEDNPVIELRDTHNPQTILATSALLRFSPRSYTIGEGVKPDPELPEFVIYVRVQIAPSFVSAQLEKNLLVVSFSNETLYLEKRDKDLVQFKSARPSLFEQKTPSSTSSSSSAESSADSTAALEGPKR